MNAIKNLQWLVLAACLFVMGTTHVMADDKKDDAPSVPVPIILGEELKGGDARGGVTIPFTAYYQGGTIYVSNCAEFSSITITVENETTGQVWNSTTDTSDGMGEICISDGSAGCYTVEIMTEYEVIFYGTFTLD